MTIELETATLSIWYDHGGDPGNPLTPTIEVGDTYFHPEFPTATALSSDPDAWKIQAVELAVAHGWRVADDAAWVDSWSAEGGFEGAPRYKIMIVREVVNPRDLMVIRDGNELEYWCGVKSVGTDAGRFTHDDQWKLEAEVWAGSLGWRVKADSEWVTDGLRSWVRVVEKQ